MKCKCGVVGLFTRLFQITRLFGTHPGFDDTDGLYRFAIATIEFMKAPRAAQPQLDHEPQILRGTWWGR